MDWFNLNLLFLALIFLLFFLFFLFLLFFMFLLFNLNRKCWLFFNTSYDSVVCEFLVASRYVNELLDRLSMLQTWHDTTTPTVFWVSGFFFTPAFMTAALQNFARANNIPIDSVDYDFHVMSMDPKDYNTGPATGVYIHGLFLEGCVQVADPKD
jgi:hypothetical protein